MYEGKDRTDWSDPTSCESALDALTAKIAVLNGDIEPGPAVEAWAPFLRSSAD